jgi:hypothetical protein
MRALPSSGKVLLCNNTANRLVCLIKDDGTRQWAGIMAETVNEEDDLARRFFALWSEYLTALMSDPKMAEPLQRWLTVAADSLQRHPAFAHDDVRRAASGPAADAPAAAGAPGERDTVMADLARRVDELAERVATLEHSRPAAASRRRRPRTSRS